MYDLPVFIGSALGLLGIIGLGEALRVWLDWPPEASRRWVHALTGLFVAFTPLLFEQPGWIYVLAGGFVGFNIVAARRRWLKGMHGIGRASWGTVTFPLALLLALYLCWTLAPDRAYILSVAFLVLATADPAASFVGRRFGGKQGRGAATKSVVGSAAFGVTAFLATGLGLWAWQAGGVFEVSVPYIAGVALVVAVLTTAVEALGRKGWDNFFIVLAVLVVLTALHTGQATLGGWMAAVWLAACFGWAAWRIGFLAGSGALAAGLLAVSVVALGGWTWTVPGMVYFFLSSLLSKGGGRRKATLRAVAEKGSRRDAGQVYANGGVAWAVLLASGFFAGEVWYWAYLGAFAAAAADTWATEVGTGVRGPTWSILTGRRMEAGLSGGVSVAGTVAALVGAVSVPLSAWPVAPVLYAGAVGWITVCGFAGSLVDSLAGATVQALYRSPEGLLTEQPSSNGRPHTRVRGWPWINNDRVNLICTLAGALLACTCYVIVR